MSICSEPFGCSKPLFDTIWGTEIDNGLRNVLTIAVSFFISYFLVSAWDKIKRQNASKL